MKTEKASDAPKACQGSGMGGKFPRAPRMIRVGGEGWLGVESEWLRLPGGELGCSS